MKDVIWMGSSKEDLQAFSESAKNDLGFNLHLVQLGMEPGDWKPMNSVGAGVCELRFRERAGAYRLMYVAKIGNAVYVLHCFQKKTQQTSKQDLELAKKRFKEI